MSSEATLFAEDTPTPPSPGPKPPPKRGKPKPNTLLVASVADRIPVFWLFCFKETDLADVWFEGERYTAIVSETAAVSERLAGRDRLAKKWFPQHAKLWARWREVIDALGRKYLKLDPHALSEHYDSADEFGGLLVLVLDCIEHENKPPFDDLPALLALAGIRNYDAKKHSFRPPKGVEPEWFLVGGNEGVEVWPGGGRPRRGGDR